MATDGIRGGGGTILPTGCTKPPVAKVDEGKAVVCATETTAMVCVVPLWMVVVVNNLRTGPLVGVKGIENLTVAALLTTLAATLVCVVETAPPTTVFRSVKASTDCGTLCRLSPRGFPILTEVIGRELTVDERVTTTVETAVETLLLFGRAVLEVEGGGREEEASDREEERGTL